MTSAEFSAQMERLSSRWKSVYSEELVKLIWREVGHISGNLFRQVADHLIGECRQPPLLPEIRDAIASRREREWQATKQSSPNYSWNGFAACRQCGDMGVILCRHDTRLGFWAFRCSCERGISDPRQAIPALTSTHESDGFTYFDPRTYRFGAEVVNE